MDKIQGIKYLLIKDNYTAKEVGNIIMKVAQDYGANKYKTVEVTR